MTPATQPATQITNYTLSTVGGVIAISFAITETIKYFVTPKTPILGKIPVTAIPILVAGILTVLANQVLKTPDGHPLLQGDLTTLIVTVMVSASSASGAYSWLRSGATSTGESKSIFEGGTTKNEGENTTMKPLPMIFVGLVLAGTMQACQCPQKAVLREAMNQSTATIRQDALSWGQKLVAYPVGVTDPRTGQPSTGQNQASQIPPLTPLAYQEMQAAEKQYEDLVNQDRASDNKSIFGPPAPTTQP